MDTNYDMMISDDNIHVCFRLVCCIVCSYISDTLSITGEPKVCWTQITKFLLPTWSPNGSCRPQMGIMLLAPLTLLFGKSLLCYILGYTIASTRRLTPRVWSQEFSSHVGVMIGKHIPHFWLLCGIHHSPVDSPHEKPVMRSFDALFVDSLHMSLNK